MADRLAVRKTYKLYVDGQFPRSESGRTYPVLDATGDVVANAVLASRKDLREAVRAARKAQPGWSAKTAYNRGQVLYRVAEIMEGRRDQLAAELAFSTTDAGAARAEVSQSIDRWVWYAGWADKLAHVAGTVNSVAGPYYAFSVPEPSGVVGLVCADEPPLLGLVSRLAPAIVSGNAAVVLASERWPLVAVTLAEALATSDVPAGVINVLTGRRAELVPWLAGHHDVDSIDLHGCLDDHDLLVAAEREAAAGVKRVVKPRGLGETIDAVTDFVEFKSVWHPIGP